MQGVLHPLFRALPFRPAVLLLTLLSLAPAAFIFTRVAEASRDIAYWDEFDTALTLVLQLDGGIGWRDFLGRLFEISNEHRMVTSRLMFASSYWLTGTVDFSVISWIGNASLLGLCALLVWSAKTTVRRLRMGLVLALLLFQLEHYENFLWSGSSIDHFQVVLMASAAVAGLAANNRVGLLAGILCAVLATFTLAHGIVVWGVGVGMLCLRRRFAHLAAWTGVGAIAALGFFAGFDVNSAQRFAEPSVAGAIMVGRYWLAALGSVPALGNLTSAPWLGGGLLIALAIIGLFGAPRREAIAFPLACYAILALALIAIGRAADSNGLVHSRYYVLSALAWALVIFMWLGRFSHPRRPLATLWGCIPTLIIFNVAANQMFAHKADNWLECRDRAAVRFKQHGVDGRGPFALYPIPARSTEILMEAERRGIYRMAPVCDEVKFPDARLSTRITYNVDELDVSGRAASIAGWATIPGMPSKRAQLHIMFKSATETHVFTAVTITRPDVATALQRPESTLSGFRFARLRDSLPTGEYQIGFLIDHDDGAEYIMSEHRVLLVGDGKALLANAD
jgi:hypothetical protein